MRILYVEDSESYSAEILRTYLGGHAVTHCMTLEQALLAYRPGLFDLILLDYDLPDGQGESVAERVRGGGDMVPIIANSNSLRKNTILMEAGANALVTKGEEETKLPALLQQFAQ